MTSNDVLRTLRFILNVNGKEMVRIAGLGGAEVSVTVMEQYLKVEDDPEFKICPQLIFSQFLNGLIYLKRGKDESRPPLQATNKVSNNLVLKKLRVAFALKDEEMIQIFKKGGQTLSKSEFSALFRAENHVNYCECGDQFLRRFFKGLSEKGSVAKK